MGPRISTDVLYRQLVVLIEQVAADINKTMKGMWVIPAKRKNGLGKRAIKYPISMRPYGASYLSVLTNLAPREAPNKIKIAVRLMKRIANELYSVLRDIPNTEILAFASNFSVFNGYIINELVKNPDLFLPKWERGHLYFYEEQAKKEGFILPADQYMLGNIHDIPAPLRRYVNTDPMAERYLNDLNDKRFDPIRKLANEKKEIILIDDTINQGISLSFQMMVLHLLGIPYEHIHPLALLNEIRRTIPSPRF